jgi:selenide, water dikinase
MEELKYKLTEYSKGGGCGCKIAPSVLQEIIGDYKGDAFAGLLVGNESSDDAAVYQLDEHTAIVSTTDFFMPIVDNPFDFGRIAAANAISDIYAMGGKPLMAIAILGWPVDRLPAEVAKEVLDGARAICQQCNMPLAGGHTIDSSDPIFGLAVTGTVHPKKLKQNNTAKAGDLLFLTKAIGVGILATAVKRKLISDEHYTPLLQQLTTVNSIGEQLAKINGVHAMTDVTGFGILGHLGEMAEGSGLSAELNYSKLKRVAGLQQYIDLKTIPGATGRNWKSVADRVQIDSSIDIKEAQAILPDPQTNGGILIAVAPESVEEITQLFARNGLDAFTEPIGRLREKSQKVIYVK